MAITLSFPVTGVLSHVSRVSVHSPFLTGSRSPMATAAATAGHPRGMGALAGVVPYPNWRIVEEAINDKGSYDLGGNRVSAHPSFLEGPDDGHAVDFKDDLLAGKFIAP